MQVDNIAEETVKKLGDYCDANPFMGGLIIGMTFGVCIWSLSALVTAFM